MPKGSFHYMCKIKFVIRIIALLLLFVPFPSWALWKHKAGGATWGFTYTGVDNKCAVIDNVTEPTSSSLTVPSIVWHDGSDDTDTWPVVRLDLRSGRNAIKNTVTSISIPGGVSIISGCSFQDCIYLQSAGWATINPATVGEYLFLGCSNLIEVTLPATISSMGKGVFKGCSKLRTVELPATLTNIEALTFNGCSSLSSFTIPKNVVEIGDSAFRGCYSLREIAIPAGVTTIGEYAFHGCSSLQCVVIPENVASLGEYAFANCTGLKKAFVPISLKGKLGLVKRKETAFSDMSIVEFYSGSSPIVVSIDETFLGVDKEWMEENAQTYISNADGDYAAAASARAANGMRVYECYVAGLDPTNSEGKFTSRIELREGTPVITWDPNLNDEQEGSRVYTIYGNLTLDNDGWTTPTNSLHRFFKVGVDMP